MVPYFRPGTVSLLAGVTGWILFQVARDIFDRVQWGRGEVDLDRVCGFMVCQ